MASFPGNLIATAGEHPAVTARRRHEALITALAIGLAAALALAIALNVPDPNVFLALGLVAGAVGLVALAASVRYEVTLTFLALYLGLCDGVVKLKTGNDLVSSLRDLMIGAICVGALVRMVVRRDQVKLPPLSGWVIAWALLTLVMIANPNTHGAMKVIGGFRQQLEWLPFFFLGYLVMRSRRRFRNFFLLLGVIALANGVVSTIQTQLTPQELSSWGPGYAERIKGTGNVSGRTYVDEEGNAHVRPPALGSDLGFGGFVGVLALPGLLALLGTGQLRKRWPVLLLVLGSVVAIATSLQRTAVLGAAIAVIAFIVLSASAGRRATRVLTTLLVIAGLTVAFVSILAPSAGKGVFDRYADISPSKAVDTSVNYREGTLAEIPDVVSEYPFGAGLAVVGAGASFGGRSPVTINGHAASAESQYNYVTVELGVPGLVLWCALSLTVIALAARRLRGVADVELRLDLAAIFATIVAFTVMGFVGPTMSNLPFGPFFWFAVGIAAYWFVEVTRRQRAQGALGSTPAPAPAPL